MLLYFCRCNGRNGCHLYVSSLVYLDQCPHIYKYLKVFYVCQAPGIYATAFKLWFTYIDHFVISNNDICYINTIYIVQHCLVFKDNSLILYKTFCCKFSFPPTFHNVGLGSTSSSEN